MKQTRFVVQVGTFTDTEYIWVTEKGASIPAKYQLPHIRAIDEAWEYYGVDRERWCVERLSKRHADNPNAYFMCATIGSIAGDICVSLTDIISPIEGSFEALIIDTENCEHSILQSYDWQRKPKCIVLEIHTLESQHAILQLLVSLGYCLLRLRPTNAGFTREAIYIHEDSFDLTSERWHGAGLGYIPKRIDP